LGRKLVEWKDVPWERKLAGQWGDSWVRPRAVEWVYSMVWRKVVLKVALMEHS
jgi:hypothetical protein